jgi:hypothetical protein
MLPQNETDTPSDWYLTGSRDYKLTNHLGNVLSVITDKKIGVSSGGSTIDYYRAEVLSQQDYYPFGMTEPERRYKLKDYRFGFNGQEGVNEITGSGNHYTAMFWEMDPRIGIRWSLDPKYRIGESRYAVNGNNPIIYTDPLDDFKTRFGAGLYELFHGGEIERDARSGQYFVGKQVDYIGEGYGAAYQRRFDWNGGRTSYAGSGWGHSARSMAASIFNVTGQVSNLYDLGWNSILQNRCVQLTGDLLEKVK